MTEWCSDLQATSARPMLAGARYLEHARALALTTLLCGQLLLVLVTRSPQRPFRRTPAAGNNGCRSSPVARCWRSSRCCTSRCFARFFEVAPLGPLEWAVALGIAIVATLRSEPLKR